MPCVGPLTSRGNRRPLVHPWLTQLQRGLPGPGHWRSPRRRPGEESAGAEGQPPDTGLALGVPAGPLSGAHCTASSRPGLASLHWPSPT